MLHDKGTGPEIENYSWKRSEKSNLRIQATDMTKVIHLQLSTYAYINFLYDFSINVYLTHDVTTSRISRIFRNFYYNYYSYILVGWVEWHLVRKLSTS